MFLRELKGSAESLPLRTFPQLTATLFIGSSTITETAAASSRATPSTEHTRTAALASPPKAVLPALPQEAAHDPRKQPRLTMPAVSTPSAMVLQASIPLVQQPPLAAQTSTPSATSTWRAKARPQALHQHHCLRQLHQHQLS